jgi:hypothetical protein
MSNTPRILQLAIAVLAGALLGGGGYAIAASNSIKTIHGCVVKKGHQLLIEKHCRRDETTLTWDQKGPAGLTGARGATGATGATGLAGAPRPGRPERRQRMGGRERQRQPGLRYRPRNHTRSHRQLPDEQRHRRPQLRDLGHARQQRQRRHRPPDPCLRLQRVSRSGHLSDQHQRERRR